MGQRSWWAGGFWGANWRLCPLNVCKLAQGIDSRTAAEDSRMEFSGGEGQKVAWKELYVRIQGASGLWCQLSSAHIEACVGLRWVPWTGTHWSLHLSHPWGATMLHLFSWRQLVRGWGIWEHKDRYGRAWSSQAVSFNDMSPFRDWLTRQQRCGHKSQQLE